MFKGLLHIIYSNGDVLYWNITTAKIPKAIERNIFIKAQFVMHLVHALKRSLDGLENNKQSIIGDIANNKEKPTIDIKYRIALRMHAIMNTHTVIYAMGIYIIYFVKNKLQSLLWNPKEK